MHNKSRYIALIMHMHTYAVENIKLLVLNFTELPDLVYRIIQRASEASEADSLGCSIEISCQYVVHQK